MTSTRLVSVVFSSMFLEDSLSHRIRVAQPSPHASQLAILVRLLEAPEAEETLSSSICGCQRANSFVPRGPLMPARVCTSLLAENLSLRPFLNRAQWV